MFVVCGVSTRLPLKYIIGLVILSIAVIYLLLSNQNLIGMFLYAVGGSIGAYLVVPKEDSEKKPSE